VAVEGAREALADASLVVTATSSRQPVLSADWLAEDVFVAAVGSNWLDKSELDIETVRRAERIVCDSLASCQAEAGELAAAAGAGAFRWDRAEELAQIVAGSGSNKGGRGITVFKSVGMALEDLATASLLLKT
jgi:ornithine cyclodeaminase/alanine dehydrogenase-like protein (mu-crystallin family)